MFTVYKHTAPNGKVYIGITSQTPKDRWQDGFGYEYNTNFWHDIVKYGWDNISHEILYEDVSKEVAQQLETELIHKYKSTNFKYGYNVYESSRSIYRGESARQKHSERMKALWQNPDYRNKMIKQSKQLWQSDEYKAKVKAGHNSHAEKVIV